MKRAIIVVVIVVAVLAAGLYVLRRGRAAAESYRFRTARVDRGWVQSTVTASGSLSAVATVQVGTQVSGTLEAIYVDFNTAVAAGEKLAQIEPSSFQAQVDQAEASWQAAEAAVDPQVAEVRRRIARAALRQRRGAPVVSKGVQYALIGLTLAGIGVIFWKSR